MPTSIRDALHCGLTEIGTTTAPRARARSSNTSFAALHESASNPGADMRASAATTKSGIGVQLALPFHDHEPRGATITCLPVIVAGLGLRLIEKRKL